MNAQTAPPNAVTFQGRLARPDGTPVPDGTYNLRLRFYDAATDGNVKHEQEFTNASVKNGVIALLLSGFTADKFNGNTWLGIKIGADAELTPRTQIVSVPYAIKSNLALSVPDSSITNAKIAPGTLTADKFAANIFNPLAWLLGGNNGVTSGFLGTTDNQPLEFRVNGRRAVRYQYAENTVTVGSEYRSINVLGGSDINSISAAVEGGTIAGGGYDRFSGTDLPNRVFGDFGAIGGGYNNTTNGNSAVIAGGYFNTASADYSSIGGGYTNTASGVVATVAGGDTNTGSGNLSTVGGGYSHLANGYASTIAGGYDNTASNQYASIGGGRSNTASGINSTVAGGYSNAANGNDSTVGGGFSNLASGRFSTVPGGDDNSASGEYSFAAGRSARANHDGTFVWADNNFTSFTSTAANQFLIRAAGGVGINTNNPGNYDLSVNGTVYISGSLTVGNVPFGDYRNLQINGNTGQLYYDNSSRKHKQNITPLVDDFDKLLQAVPMTYTRPNAPGRWEIGFIAEEFHDLGLKRLVDYSDKGEVEGINYEKICLYLTAIAKKQNERSVQQQKQMDTLTKENAAIRNDNASKNARISELEKRLDAIERALVEKR